MRNLIFGRIDEILDGHGIYNQSSLVERFRTLLGSMINGLDSRQMVEIWLTGASYIGAMYNQRVKSRKGIG